MSRGTNKLKLQLLIKPHKCGYDYSGGFSLLEVMLALFVLSFSLLALANFTTIAWRRTYDANFVNWSVNAQVNSLLQFMFGNIGFML